MKRALVLACGNPQRGDDSAALHIADSLRCGISDAETEIHSQQQWTPELAERISKAEVVIFVDAAAGMPPGEVACKPLQPAQHASRSITHHTSPESLLWLAGELYGKHPALAYLVTVGGISFDLTEELSEPVRHAIPRAADRIKALLSGVQAPESPQTPRDQ
ncbi:MAG: hydrogenase maturation protease [Candidatus Acidiferrum sp.]